MADDYSSDITTTGVLTVGGSATGQIESQYSDDADWFKLTLAAGTNYLFALDGSNVEADTQFGVSLHIYDAQGKMIGQGVYDLRGNSPIMSFSAATAGDYYIAVVGWRAYGSYTLAAAMQPPDDLPRDNTTPAELIIGTPFQARFEMAGDQDWIKIHLEAGKFYSYTYKKDSVDAVYPTDFTLFDADGNEASSQAWEPTVTGDYYIALQGNQAGPYTITASSRQDDYSQNTATTGAVSQGTPATGRLDFRYDEDFFRVTLSKGIPVTFALKADADDLRLTALDLADSAGNRMEADSYLVGDVRYLTVTPQNSGEFFVVVSAEGLLGGATKPSYTLSMPKDDHADFAAQATPIALGAGKAGTLGHPFDTDFMSVQLEAGKLYGFELAYASSDVLQLWLMLPDGSTSYSFTSPEQNSFSFTPETSGAYTVRVTGSSASYPAAYTVKAGALQDDVGSTAATAASLAIGTPRMGSLQPGGGDRDWFAVTLGAGLAYKFVLEGESNGAGTLQLSQTTVNVLDAAGKVVYTIYPGSYSSDPNFTPQTGGTYYAEVLGSASGTYRIGVMGDYHDDVGNTAATATKLRNGVAFNGVNERTSDIDVFRIDAQAGDIVMVKALPAAGSDVNSLGISLTDAGGTALTVVPDSFAQTMQFTAVSAGPYYVHVAPYMQGSYTITSTLAGVDDLADTYAASKPMNGTQIQGTLNHLQDIDVVRVSLTAGQTYRFVLSGKADGGGTLDTSAGMFLRLHSGADTTWSLRAEADPGTLVEYKVDTSGEYYLELGTRQYELGSYTLRMSSSVSDLVAPVIKAYSHAPGSTNFNIADTLTIQFSEPVQQTGYVWLVDDAHRDVALHYPGSTVYSLVNGDTLTFDPVEPLKAGTTYTVQVDQYAIRDLSGNSFAGKSFSFTTAGGTPATDSTAPTLVTQSHLPGATNIGLHETLSFTFNEAVAIGGAPTLVDENGIAVALATPLVNGNTLTIDPQAFLLPGAKYSLNLGSVKDLAGNSYAPTQALNFTTIAASPEATAGNDFLAASGKGMTLNGGAGIDTAVYRNIDANYLVDRIDGKTMVTAAGSGMGDTLTGIERLMFNGSAVALDIEGTGGQAYRLYQAAFNRTPDQAGVGYWMAMMDQGATLGQVATHFLASVEFAQMYGTGLSDTAFVDKLYWNVLHRQQDQAGADYWAAAMANGGTRAQVLEQFSESAENQAALIGVIGDGFTYIPLA